MTLEQLKRTSTPRYRLGTSLQDPSGRLNLLDEMGDIAPVAPEMESMMPDMGVATREKVTQSPMQGLAPIAPPSFPTLETLAPRDMGAESRRAGNAALYAGLFGLGLGSPGGVAAAPTLAAAAAGGSRQGAEQNFANQARIVDGRNEVKLSDFQNQMSSWRAQETDANRRGDELDRSDRLTQSRAMAKAKYMESLAGLPEPELQKRLENDFRSGVHDALGLELPRREDGAWDVAPVVDPALADREAARVAAESGRMGDDRMALITQLSALSPDAQQTALTLLDSSGELARRGITIPRDESGRWHIGALSKALPASMSPEAQAIEVKKRAARAYQSTIDLYEQLMRDPRVTPGARTELLKRQGILKDAIATGSDVPNWVYDISPEAIRDMSPQQREALRQRDEAIAASRERTQQMAGQFAQTFGQRERFHKDFMAGKKDKGDTGKTWESHGIPSINAIDDDVARMIKEVADLRSGPIQKSATGAFVTDQNGNPVRLPASPENLSAANALVDQIEEYQRQQEQIAASYGWRRDPTTKRWVKAMPGKTGGK